MIKGVVTTDGTPIELLSRGSEKRVVTVCDRCEKESTSSFANYCHSQIKHNRNGKTFCRRCSCQLSGVQRLGKPIKKSGPRPQVHGAKNATWKGGRFIGSDGYVKIYVGPRRYRKEHFLAMEQKIGRPLLPGEVIHHKDLCKQSNAPENLVLFANESDHRKAHNSLIAVNRQLIQNGVIEFDEDSKSYRIATSKGG